MVELDDENWPILRVTYRGRFTLEELNAALARETEIITRRGRHVRLADASDAKLTDFRIMRRQADHIQEKIDMLRDNTIGGAFVIPSAMVRGAMRAILRIQPLPYPFTIVSTVEEGEAYARRALVGEGHGRASGE